MGANPGVMGVGSVREAGDRIPKGTEAGERGNEFCNIVQYFAKEK